MNVNNLSINDVENYFLNLQKNICLNLENIDQVGRFRDDPWSKENSNGITKVLSKGKIFEQAGVNVSRIIGHKMPQAATVRHPKLVGSAFEAMGVSVVIHPANPYVPISHMNVRFFLARPKIGELNWWFGGGFDLSPCYGFVDDAVHWHRVAQKACQKFSPGLYERFKASCDDYFRVKHREEQRGIGGIFFDDFNEQNFNYAFEVTRSIGDHFLPAYLPIVERRKNLSFGKKEREFQLFRRGRYVEFNLVHDRGTRFGLESGGRTKSILVSLPPQASWHYEWPTTNEHDPQEYLKQNFLQPKDWLNNL